MVKHFRSVPLADLEMVLPGAAVSLPPNLYLSLAFTLVAGLAAAALAVWQVGSGSWRVGRSELLAGSADGMKPPRYHGHAGFAASPYLIWRSMQGAWGAQLAWAMAAILLPRRACARILGVQPAPGRGHAIVLLPHTCLTCAQQPPHALPCVARPLPSRWLPSLAKSRLAGGPHPASHTLACGARQLDITFSSHSQSRHAGHTRCIPT